MSFDNYSNKHIIDDDNQPLEQEQKTKRVNNSRHGKYKSCVYNLSFCVGREFDYQLRVTTVVVASLDYTPKKKPPKLWCVETALRKRFTFVDVDFSSKETWVQIVSRY